MHQCDHGSLLSRRSTRRCIQTRNYSALLTSNVTTFSRGASPIDLLDAIRDLATGVEVSGLVTSCALVCHLGDDWKSIL